MLSSDRQTVDDPARNKQRIVDLFKHVVQAPVLDLSSVIAYVDPSYEQCVDGVVLDYRGFVSHMQKQKDVLASVDIEFLALVAEGNTVFSNHVASAKKKDGSIVTVKVIAQFEQRDGRVLRCDELTRLVSGTAEDRDLGSRH